MPFDSWLHPDIIIRLKPGALREPPVRSKRSAGGQPATVVLAPRGPTTPRRTSVAYKAAGAKAANGRRRWWDALGGGGGAAGMVVELRRSRRIGATTGTGGHGGHARRGPSGPPPLLRQAYRMGSRACQCGLTRRRARRACTNESGMKRSKLERQRIRGQP